MPCAALVLEHDAVDDAADDPRQEEHEGVHDALDQRERDHVAVGDVADFVTQHGLDFIAAHVAQQPVLTATSAEFLLAPVAKALGSGESKMPTSGMPMPAVWACCARVHQPAFGLIGGLLR